MKIVKYLVVILILLLFGCGDIMDDLVINNELIDNHIRFTLTSKKTFFIRDYYIFYYLSLLFSFILCSLFVCSLRTYIIILPQFTTFSYEHLPQETEGGQLYNYINIIIQ